MVALSAADGSLVWKTGDDRASYCPCFPVMVGGQLQIVSFLENVLVAHDPETGQELWRDQWSDGYDEHACSLLYEPPFLFGAAPFAFGCRVLKLSVVGGEARATKVWESKVMSGDVLSGVVLGKSWIAAVLATGVWDSGKQPLRCSGGC